MQEVGEKSYKEKRRNKEKKKGWVMREKKRLFCSSHLSPKSEKERKNETFFPLFSYPFIFHFYPSFQTKNNKKQQKQQKKQQKKNLESNQTIHTFLFLLFSKTFHRIANQTGSHIENRSRICHNNCLKFDQIHIYEPNPDDLLGFICHFVLMVFVLGEGERGRGEKREISLFLSREKREREERGRVFLEREREGRKRSLADDEGKGTKIFYCPFYIFYYRKTKYRIILKRFVTFVREYDYVTFGKRA